MTNRATIDEAIRVAEYSIAKLMVQVMKAGADLSDVTTAACAVHTLGIIRRKHGPLSPEDVRLESERLATLGQRVAELDDGDDAAARTAAIAISKKPIPEVG